MKWLTWLVVMLVGIGLVVSGCKQKEEVTEPTEVIQPAKAPPVDKAAEDLAKTMAEAAKDVDTSDAPDYMKKMVGHVREINKLAKDNISDCAKAAKLIGSYVEQNQADLDEVSKKMKEAQEQASDQDKIKLGQQIMGLLGPIMQETMQTQMEFAQKCPNEAKSVSEAMQKVKMK